MGIWPVRFLTPGRYRAFYAWAMEIAGRGRVISEWEPETGERS